MFSHTNNLVAIILRNIALGKYECVRFDVISNLSIQKSERNERAGLDRTLATCLLAKVKALRIHGPP